MARLREPIIPLFLFAVALAGVAAGCAESEIECRFHSQCRRPGRCVEGRCVWDCRDDIDCDGGHCPSGTTCSPAGITADGIPISYCL